MPYIGINWNNKKEELIVLLSSGKTYNEVGNIFGVSRQRIKQVIQKFNLDVSTIGKKIIVEKEKLNKKKKQQIKFGDRIRDDLYQIQRHKFRSKKAQVKRLGKLWDLNFTDIHWPTHCPVLGIELNYFSETREENSPSFDQYIPGEGYTKGNVSIISWRANRIKNDGTLEEHKKIVMYLTKRNK